MSDQTTAKKKLKVTMSFQPSPDVVHIHNSGNLGKAGYHVMLFIDKKQSQMILPPSENSFDLIAEEESSVIATVSAIDRNGVMSLATIIRMQVPPTMPPERPTDLKISRIMPYLDVIQDPLPARPSEPVANANEYAVTVMGNSVLKDGAVGQVIGIEQEHLVRVRFTPNAFKYAAGDFDVIFDARHAPDGKITVLSPSQEQLSIGEYINLMNTQSSQLVNA